MDGSRGATERQEGYTQFRGIVNYKWLDRFINGQWALPPRSSATARPTEVLAVALTGLLAAHAPQRQLNYVTNTRPAQHDLQPECVVSTISSSAQLLVGARPVQPQPGRDPTAVPGARPGRSRLSVHQHHAKPIEVGEWLTWTPRSRPRRSSGSRSTSSDRRASSSDPIPPADRQRARAAEQPEHGDLVRYAAPDLRLHLAQLVPPPTGSTTFRSRSRSTTSPTRRTRAARLPPDVRDNLDWDTGINLRRSCRGAGTSSRASPCERRFARRFPGALGADRGRLGRAEEAPQLRTRASPSVYARFGGFGPVSAFRHQIQATLGYDFAPRDSVSDEFLKAVNATRQGYNSAEPQNIVSLGLSTNIEAKLRAAEDDTTSADNARKIKVLQLTLTTLQWDFERAKRGSRIRPELRLHVRSDCSRLRVQWVFSLPCWTPPRHGAFRRSVLRSRVCLDQNSGMSLGSRACWYRRLLGEMKRRPLSHRPQRQSAPGRVSTHDLSCRPVEGWTLNRGSQLSFRRGRAGAANHFIPRERPSTRGQRGHANPRSSASNAPESHPVRSCCATRRAGGIGPFNSVPAARSHFAAADDVANALVSPEAQVWMRSADELCARRPFSSHISPSAERTTGMRFFASRGANGNAAFNF